MAYEMIMRGDLLTSQALGVESCAIIRFIDFYIGLFWKASLSLPNWLVLLHRANKAYEHTRWPSCVFIVRVAVVQGKAGLGQFPGPFGQFMFIHAQNSQDLFLGRHENGLLFFDVWNTFSNRDSAH